MKERILILMQLQDFKRIKHRGDMKNCFCFFISKKITDILKAATGSSSVRKVVLRCIFAREFEVFWIVQSQGTLTKLGVL